MSAAKVSIRWPLWLSGWAFIGGGLAGKEGHWVIVACAVITLISAWAFWGADQ